MITEMSGELQGVAIDSRLMVSHTPIDTESFVVRYGVMVKKLPGLSEEENLVMTKEYVKQSQAAFNEDIHIWHTKVRVDNPVLCDGDGPVPRLRQWYDQFYVDVADVPEIWEQRKVHTLNSHNAIPGHRMTELKESLTEAL